MEHCSPPTRVTTMGLSVAATAAAAIPLITSSEFVTAVSVSTGNTASTSAAFEQQAQRGVQFRGSQRRPRSTGLRQDVRAQDTRGARSLTVGKIDEADRLKTNGLEQLRDFFDRHDLGVIPIGMPGFDRQLARYPQLYSRIGFAHQDQPLDPEDIPAVLTHHWQQLGLHDTNLDPDGELVGTIVRITAGNFRLIERS